MRKRITYKQFVKAVAPYFQLADKDEEYDKWLQRTLKRFTKRLTNYTEDYLKEKNERKEKVVFNIPLPHPYTLNLLLRLLIPPLLITHTNLHTTPQDSPHSL